MTYVIQFTTHKFPVVFQAPFTHVLMQNLFWQFPNYEIFKIDELLAHHGPLSQGSQGNPGGRGKPGGEKERKRESSRGEWALQRIPTRMTKMGSTWLAWICFRCMELCEGQVHSIPSVLSIYMLIAKHIKKGVGAHNITLLDWFVLCWTHLIDAKLVSGPIDYTLIHTHYFYLYYFYTGVWTDPQIA